MEKKHFMIMMTAGELCELIEAKTKELGRDITNEELNELVTNSALQKQKGEILAVSDKPFDSGLLTGNMREDGLKVLNLNEEAEKKRRDGEEGSK